MKLVVIGNGFDLYHGLPSKYSDFSDIKWNISYREKNSSREEEIETLLNQMSTTQKIDISFFKFQNPNSESIRNEILGNTLI